MKLNSQTNNRLLYLVTLLPKLILINLKKEHFKYSFALFFVRRNNVS